MCYGAICAPVCHGSEGHIRLHGHLRRRNSALPYLWHDRGHGGEPVDARSRDRATGAPDVYAIAVMEVMVLEQPATETSDLSEEWIHVYERSALAETKLREPRDASNVQQ